jgi:hypothetical protein
MNVIKAKLYGTQIAIYVFPRQYLHDGIAIAHILEERGKQLLNFMRHRQVIIVIVDFD